MVGKVNLLLSVFQLILSAESGGIRSRRVRDVEDNQLTDEHNNNNNKEKGDANGISQNGNSP
jgi:hypothetical protein